MSELCFLEHACIGASRSSDSNRAANLLELCGPVGGNDIRHGLHRIFVRNNQSRSNKTAQVIQELIDLAKDMREAHGRGEKLGFTEEELAFYDALEVNDSAVKVLGDETLKAIARELVDTVRRNVSIDWTVKESVRAKLNLERW